MAVWVWARDTAVCCKASSCAVSGVGVEIPHDKAVNTKTAMHAIMTRDDLFAIVTSNE